MSAAAELYDTTNPQVGYGLVDGQASDQQFDVDGIIEAINRPKRGGKDRMQDGRLRGHKMVGFGEERPSCGDPFHLFCECCGAPQQTGDCCRKSDCPRCVTEWVRERAYIRSSQMWALKLARAAGHMEDQRLHHVVISPFDYLAHHTSDEDEEWRKARDWCLEADDPLERTKDVVKQIMKEYFGGEGLIIYHEYRARSKDDPWDVEDSRGVWKEIIGEGYDWEDVAPGSPGPEGVPQLVRAPHFHCIVVCPEIPGPGVTDVVYEETGWIIHRIHDVRNISIANKAELASVLAYCISHTVLYEDSNGNNRGAIWEFGQSFGGTEHVTASDNLKEEFDLIVRAIAPKILDLDYQMLICPVDLPEKLVEKDRDGRVNVNEVLGQLEIRGAGHAAFLDAGDGERFDSASPGDASDSSDSGAGDLDDGLWEPLTAATSSDKPILQTDEAREMVETSRRTRCSGRLLSIAVAGREHKPEEGKIGYLNNPEWCEQAKYSEQTRETYEQYADDPDHWVGTADHMD